MSPIERSDSLLLQTRAKWFIPNEIRKERPAAALRGADGEYVHSATQLPVMLGRLAQFWTDRRSS